MSYKKRVLCVVLVLVCGLSFCQCRLKEKDPNVLLVSGVLSSYKPNNTPNFSNVTGGAYAHCLLNDIENILHANNLKEATFVGSAYEYEMVLAMLEDEYYPVVQADRSREDIPVLFALAYSYETGDVYLFRNEKTYLLEAPDDIRLQVGNLFARNGIYSDTKFFWRKADVLRDITIENRENSCYSWGFSFRFDRYWCLEAVPKKSDFTQLENYQASNMEQMIVNAADALGYQAFEACVADDMLTGYWRIEFYDRNSEASSLVYFDDAFQVVFGF